MKKRPDLSQKDWELCFLYLGELKRQDISAHEPWERELEAWAADPTRYPRRSTLAKLRIRFPNTPRTHGVTMHKRAFEKIKSGNPSAGVSHALSNIGARGGRRIGQDQCKTDTAEEPRCALDDGHYCSGGRGAAKYHVRKPGVLLLAVLVLFVSSGFASVSISGAGSTFIDPAFVKWVAAYAKIEPDVRLDYQAVGSLQGVDRLLAHSTDFAASDAPLHLEQMNEPSCGTLYFPAVIGAVVAAYNLPQLPATSRIKLTGAMGVWLIASLVILCCTKFVMASFL